MTGTPSIPELLDQYMEETGQSGQWITVQEFRTYFHLHESERQAIAGFLRKIHHGPYAACRFRVSRIERIHDAGSPPPYDRKVPGGETI